MSFLFANKAIELIQTVSAQNTFRVGFRFPPGYSIFWLICPQLYQNAGRIYLLFSLNGAVEFPVFITTNYGVGGYPGRSQSRSGPITQLYLQAGAQQALTGGAFTVQINNPARTGAPKNLNWQSIYRQTTGVRRCEFGAGEVENNGALDYVALGTSGTFFTVVNLSLYGIKSGIQP